ncbi:MAG: hypothetical protein DLD55_01065 [candidate division SR1 bacterium]|nr:MAG: hypothetical protein DLD55_01065 [candidate division SR1 bacterium]
MKILRKIIILSVLFLGNSIALYGYETKVDYYLKAKTDLQRAQESAKLGTAGSQEALKRAQQNYKQAQERYFKENNIQNNKSEQKTNNKSEETIERTWEDDHPYNKAWEKHRELEKRTNKIYEDHNDEKITDKEFERLMDEVDREEKLLQAELAKHGDDYFKKKLEELRKQREEEKKKNEKKNEEEKKDEKKNAETEEQIEQEGGENKCKGIKLNTDVPFVGNCIQTSKQTKEGETTQINAFPKLMGAMMRLLMMVILIMSVLMIIAGGVLLTMKGSVKQIEDGMALIQKVAIGMALLGASGVILKLINPNFFT